MKIPLRVLIIWVMMLSAISELFAYERRLRVPDYFSCERNLVTSWHGVISGYQRNDNSLDIEVSTDADTVELLTLNYTHPNELLSRFYLHDRPFNDLDWDKIESSSGIIKKKIPVTVWLCEDQKTKPLINWRPRKQ
ncbi:hypothetical protein SG35_006655 [Thalassomonas actiniarum]|uniref:Uncharacterized protein n=2 Tax=Thalassomonas actiniarum TaxID=485447 RepID=A0AAF0C4S0_9GAMM|nr:hypothetical protein SG35_006655 [Thalassomonas actiniarum]